MHLFQILIFVKIVSTEVDHIYLRKYSRNLASSGNKYFQVQIMLGDKVNLYSPTIDIDHENN